MKFFCNKRLEEDVKPKLISQPNHAKQKVNDKATSKLNPFSTNVPLTDKPGSWFLLAKCLKNKCGRAIFSVKTQAIFA